jgi:REP-associated tyrosine transposase
VWIDVLSYSDMSVRKGYHCAYEIHYHIVFPVKYRKALLSVEIESALVRISHEIQDRYEIIFDQMGCDLDHIHLLCSAHPKYSPGDIVRIYKSLTARQLFRDFPSLKKELWGGEFWTDGYYVATVGERNNWDTVAKYVQNQGKNGNELPLRKFSQLNLF